MNVGDFAQAHGYALLALGLLFEGETAVLLASAAAHQGWLRLPAVFALAFGMAWMLDQTMFWLGRRRGAAMLARWRPLARAAVRARRLVLRYPQACVLGVRFAYGLRWAGPVLIGASGLPPLRFAGLSALAAGLWASLMCALGWLFAQVLEQALHYASRLQVLLLFTALLLVALAAWRLARRQR